MAAYFIEGDQSKENNSSELARAEVINYQPHEGSNSRALEDISPDWGPFRPGGKRGHSVHFCSGPHTHIKVTSLSCLYLSNCSWSASSKWRLWWFSHNTDALWKRTLCLNSDCDFLPRFLPFLRPLPASSLGKKVLGRCKKKYFFTDDKWHDKKIQNFFCYHITEWPTVRLTDWLYWPTKGYIWSHI